MLVKDGGLTALETETKILSVQFPILPDNGTKPRIFYL